MIPRLFAIAFITVLTNAFCTMAHAAIAQGQYQGFSLSMGFSVIAGEGTHVHVDNVTSDLPGIETCKAFMHQNTETFTANGKSTEELNAYYKQYEGKTVEMGNLRLLAASPRNTFCLFDTLSIVE